MNGQRLQNARQVRWPETHSALHHTRLGLLKGDSYEHTTALSPSFPVVEWIIEDKIDLICLNWISQ